jgi:hypothetical protein
LGTSVWLKRGRGPAACLGAASMRIGCLWGELTGRAGILAPCGCLRHPGKGRIGVLGVSHVGSHGRVGEPGRALRSRAAGFRAPRGERRTGAASPPLPTPSRGQGLKPEREWAGRAAAGERGRVPIGREASDGWRGRGARGPGEGEGGRGAPAAGRGGPGLPARCSRRRSQAACSPQRD